MHISSLLSDDNKKMLVDLYLEALVLDRLVVLEQLDVDKAQWGFNYALTKFGINPATADMPDYSGSRSKFHLQLNLESGGRHEVLSPSYDGTSLDEVANWLAKYIDS